MKKIRQFKIDYWQIFEINDDDDIRICSVIIRKFFN